jgi:hypothetical protein
MGLYVMKENEQELLRMGFENILNFITERPKQILSELPSEDSQTT